MGSRIYRCFVFLIIITGLLLAACQPTGIIPGTTTPMDQDPAPSETLPPAATFTPTATPQPTSTFQPSPTPLPTQTSQPTPSATSSPTPNNPVIDCMGSKPGDKLKVVYEWYGQDEEKINSVFKPLLTACGIQIEGHSVKGPGQIGWQFSLNPDILFSSSPQVFTQYTAHFKDLAALGAHAENYPRYWVDLGSSKGQWLIIPIGVDIKSMIWYSPTRFKALGYEVPSTLDELNNLVEKMVQDKNIPWSMGLANNKASGEKGIEFAQDIILAQQGSQYIWDVISRKVRYDDKGIAPAFQLYLKWATDPAYAVGGEYGTQQTYYLDAIDKVFAAKPSAMMIKAPGSTGFEIAKKYPGLKFGDDYAFFPFPGFSEQGVQIDADYMMALNDTPAVRAALAYLTGAVGVEAWVKAGLGASPNNLALGKSSNPVFNGESAMLVETTAFTPTFHQAMITVGSLAGESFFDLINNAVIYMLQGAEPIKAIDQIMEDELEKPGE